MEHDMVNSISIGVERNGNTKASCMQANVLHIKMSSSPLTASVATQSKNDLMETTDIGQFNNSTHADEPTPSQTKSDDQKGEKDVPSTNLNISEANETKKTLFCSFPLERVQTILSKYTSSKSDGSKMKAPRKVLCLYCDRTFVNVNLRQKHVERCHSSKQLRRVSLRKNQNFLTNTPCIYCDKFTSTEHTLKDLFKHLIDNHSNKYFGCLSCEVRFLNSSHLADHNVLCHDMKPEAEPTPNSQDSTVSFHPPSNLEAKEVQESSPKVPRRKQKARKGNKIIVVDTTDIGSIVEETTIKTLRNKKLSVKSSRMILKRSKRLQAKVSDPCRKKQTREVTDKKKSVRPDILSEKSNKATSFVNPYPEFDRFYQPRQITDHSIDNLKISSLTFDDVFDKAFFSRIKCNIQENLLHHIDGKLFKNEESESRISNFEKNANVTQETQSLNTENYGCELSLNAIAPTTLLLSNPLGDDPESQIEYGSKPSKKKAQMKKDEVHYKYFTRRKYQASILEHKENRDLSKLDMWTQYLIKNRQQKIIDDKRSPKEIVDYFASEEYKNTVKMEELNRILDRRGPFEDLREEASKKAALDKLNGENIYTDDGHVTEIGELLNDILDKVFELAAESRRSLPFKENVVHVDENVPEIPSYLNLRPTSSLTHENEIDRSDKIALICSSQETENFELPSNTVRGKNEKVELTGEWARSRIYVCAACGIKLQNIKQFLEHKSASHQYIWVQHYEFVGNQSELYRHLSIPVLGKVGVLENTVQCKIWKRSDARLCTKCGKRCNSLGELHRHILECGGDWTWMLARKKCKYRPFGAKSRRKRRGLVKRIYPQKSEPSEKKIYKKPFDMPRQKPSDADSIKRMLANLPPKRATRKVISLKDGFNTTRSKRGKNTKQSKFKCGKLVHGKIKEQAAAKTDYEKTGKNQRRSLRSLNKVLASRILDTNSSLMARRKYTRKIKGEQKKNRTEESESAAGEVQESLVKAQRKVTKASSTVKVQNVKEASETKSKRSSPRIGKRVEFSAGSDKMNIKRFFPIKKKGVMESATSAKGTSNSPRDNKNVHEIKNGVSKVVLRKRKSEVDVESGVAKKVKVRKTSPLKTRKMKTLKNTVDESNELSSVSTEEKTEDVQKESTDFFEVETKTSVDLSDTPPLEKSDLVEDQKVPSDTVEKQAEPDALDLKENLFTKPTSDKFFFGSQSPPRHEQTKRKMKKPARGLNDCIAMLTSKLSKDFEEQKRTEVCVQSNSNHVIEEKPESILKVPFSTEHFLLSTSNKDSECLDVSNDFRRSMDGAVAQDDKIVSTEIVSVDLSVIKTGEGEESSGGDRVVTLEQSDNSFEDLKEGGDKNLSNSLDASVVMEEKVAEACKESTDTVLQLSELDNIQKLVDGINGIMVQNTQSEDNHDSDSEDDVPLLALLRDEQSDRDLVPRNSGREETVFSPLVKEINEEEKSLTQIKNNGSLSDKVVFNGLHLDEKCSSDDNEPINEDPPVLTKIDDHFEYVESETVAEEVGKINLVDKQTVDEAAFVSSELDLEYTNPNDKADSILKNTDTCDVVNITSDDKEVDLVTLDEHSIECVLSKLEKISVSPKKCVNTPKPKDLELDVEPNLKENKLKLSSFECKKNSKSVSNLSRGKHKKEKKKPVLSKFNKNKVEAEIQENSKENTDSQNVNGAKNVIRNAKTKVLESIFDDALLELSENELVPQDNLKNSLGDEVEVDTQKQEVGDRVKNNSSEENLPEKNSPCTSDENDGGDKPPDAKIEEAAPNYDYANETVEQNAENKLEVSQQSTADDGKTDGANGKELRRSSRNSKRVTCYNETDLIDPLLDDIESDRTISKILKETTKDIFGIKRKNRKKAKNGHNERKICGDELFDLLKATPNENIVLSKPTNTFFNSFNEISTDFNDDNFDAFEDILEKSMAVIEENLSQDVISPIKDVLNSHNKTVDENSTTEPEIKQKSFQKKSKKTKQKGKNRLLQKHLQNKIISFDKSSSNSGQTLNDQSEPDGASSVDFENNDLNSNENRVDFVKENDKSIYCEICDKSFCRIESLTKHKRTLTHISKLSELEAKEAALKTKSDQQSPEENEINVSSDLGKDVNLLEMLKTMDDERCKQFSSPFSVKVDSSNLKLADIINDVLNKPILKKDGDADGFSELGVQNEQPEMRRYKSLGERKSFESEGRLLAKNDTLVKNVDYFESEISSVEAGTILEKQITLLENIIENRSGLSYIDELSISSTQSVNDNVNGIDISSKQINSLPPYPDQFTKESSVKSTLKDNFLKPLQYEEISEDSNLKNYDEQKSRKVLNRDEELFLECCSLLKSGSEVSNYSKKSKHINNSQLKPCGEPYWLENSCLSHKKSDDFVECYSDSSRIQTPLGDNFSQEESNSDTISSQWEMSNPLLKKETLSSSNLTFKEVFDKNEDIFRKENKVAEVQRVASPFDVISDVLKNEENFSDESLKKGVVINIEDSSTSTDNADLKDSIGIDGKKVLTKGAMKVFEGLKVSIPTEELNIEKILVSGSPTKKLDSDSNKFTFEESKTQKSKHNSHLDKPLVKAKKKHNSKTLNHKKQNNLQMKCKVHDVYDFEETQDNSDVFTRPDFRTFRTKYDKKKFDKAEGSDDDSNCTEGVSFDAFSSSASSVSEVLPKKSRTQQNITKKKCMIMGRIFKNAVKSKVSDEDIRSIPVIDNTKLVEDFVLNCPEPVLDVKKKARMTEEEMNLAFDKLISSKPNETKGVTKVYSVSQHKSILTKKRQRPKSKKRSSGHSQSSDDEFKLQKYSKKRAKKKSNDTEDSCINLEQELRECIGVASRKSQRKCTSGKQNVLIEYWSSDESFSDVEEIVITDVPKTFVDTPVDDFVPPASKEVKIDCIAGDDNVVEAFVTEPSCKPPSCNANRRKRVAANPLYHWSSSSEDESHDLIEIRPVRDEIEDDGDRPIQHGWIVGDSPKKLVTMLAQAKGKKCDAEGVKEHGKKRTTYS